MKVTLTYRTSETSTNGVIFACRNIKFGKHPDNKKDTGLVEFDQIDKGVDSSPAIDTMDKDIQKGWLKNRMSVNKDLFGDWWAQIDGDAVVFLKVID